jgi:hypothetical protein
MERPPEGSVMDDVVDAVARYCSDEERSARLRSAFVDPVIDQLARRFSLLFKAVQGVAVLVIIQFVFVVWMFVRSYRRG